MHLEEAQLKLKDLGHALALEKQHRYVDVQGKKKRFSQFILETITWLKPLLGPTESVERCLNAFKQYPFASLSDRMSAIAQVESILNQLNQPQKPAASASPSPDSDIAQPLSDLDKPIQYLKGAGPRMAEVLKKANLHTVGDLLYYFPRKYLDYQQHTPLAQCQPGQSATVVGTIVSNQLALPKGRAIAILSVTIQDKQGHRLLGKWIFNKTNRRVLEAMKQRYPVDAEVMMSGLIKWDNYKQLLSIDRPEVEILSYGQDDVGEGSGSLHVGRIVPVYSLVEGLNLKALRRVMYEALQQFRHTIEDPLLAVSQAHPTLFPSLMPLPEALQHIHFPETTAQYQQARHRLVFDELFKVQLRLAVLRQQFKHQGRAQSLHLIPGGAVERLITQLPFQLTGAQQRVFGDIQKDMASSEPMYRLLQGDVGSGKTIVALLSLLMGVDNGMQGCLMAPTEILAEQHYRQFQRLLTPLGLKVGLLLGRQGAKERREIKQGLLNGQIHIVVGTHALIQDDVAFAHLGVVVVDEQHRFGVRQRMELKNKGEHPDMLSMTATPIPRTLALSLHGDMDVSVIDELPPGRTPIQTTVLKGKRGRDEAYELIRYQVSLGRQVYIVYPLIEDSETLSAKAATAEYELLQNEIFPTLRVGLLHGKIASEEKDQLMQAFAKAQLDILVSTTVIEVGVDVPNATVMLIENAERFGLAQLHQLRGRVGRGAHQSYCLLHSENPAQEAVDRLSLLERSSNGFEIAEYDLSTRGPGDFLGTRQSGLPDFLLADLVKDVEVLAKARDVAMAITQDPEWTERFPTLLPWLQEAPASGLELVTAG